MTRAEQIEKLIDAALSVTHHDGDDEEVGVGYERTVMRRKFRAILADRVKEPDWEKAKISIDVSTCDDDAGNRLFGRVMDWQPDASGGIRLLCRYTHDNFNMRKALKAAAADARGGE